jgi:energy-coupling factor transport system ATP-binding protein
MGLSEEEIAERVEEAAAFVGLDAATLEKSPFDLSGGQKRRAAIAGVMAMRPEVLVLDEPAAGLDPKGRDTILKGVREYGRQTGSTVIIVSHSMEDMATYCDDIIVMSRGRVFLSGSRDEVFSHAAALTEVGLDVPQITRLAMLLRERGIPLPDSIYTVDALKVALRPLLQ